MIAALRHDKPGHDKPGHDKPGHDKPGHDKPGHDKPAPGNSLAWTAEGYWSESRQPLTSLVFIAPLLLVYEAGVLLLGPDVVRNGADAWLRQLLELVGFGQYFLLPLLTVCILLGWHYTTRRRWRVSRGALWGMAGECLLLSITLWLLAQLQDMVWQASARPIAMSISPTLESIAEDTVRYLGAGIYEELLFRLILLSLTVWLLGRLGLANRPSWQRLAAAVLLTSLLFSTAHYVGQYRDVFRLDSFLFRFLAGVFFSILFVYRGFGIAAGAHAGYDILVGFFAAR